MRCKQDEENGTIVQRELERCSNELTLVFASGETAISRDRFPRTDLRHEGKRWDKERSMSSPKLRLQFLVTGLFGQNLEGAILASGWRAVQDTPPFRPDPSFC